MSQSRSAPFIPDHLAFDKNLISSNSLQLHFRDEAEAKDSHAWLQASDALKKQTLKLPHNESCTCQKGQCFIIRLTNEQVNAVWGKDVYEFFLKITQLNRRDASRENELALLRYLTKLRSDWLHQFAALLCDPSSGYACTLDGIIAHADPKFLAQYFSLLTAQTCRKAALLESQNSWNTLMSIALESTVTNQVCKMFLDQLDETTCCKAALMQNKYGGSVVTILLERRPDLFIQFAKKLDEKTCRTIAKFEDEAKETALQTILKICHSTETYNAFVAKLDKETINSTILRENTEGYNALMAAARYCHAMNFKDLLLKMDDTVFRKGVLMQTKQSHSTLSLIAYYQTSQSVFMSVLDKLDDSTCLTTVSSELKTIVMRQAPDVLIAFLKRIKSTFLGRNVLLSGNKIEESVLYTAAYFQNHEAFAALLLHLTSYTITKVQNGELVKLLFQIINTQSRENLTTFLNKLDKNTWKQLALHIISNRESLNVRLLLRGLLEKSEDQVNENSNLKEVLRVYDEFHPIYRDKTGQRYTSIFNETRKYLVSDMSDLIMEYAFPEKAVLDCFHQGRALIKVIRDDVKKNWINILNYVADYVQRESLRSNKNKSDFGSDYLKFVHMLNNFVEYRSKEEKTIHKAKKINNDGTKKTSLTAISRRMHTALFGFFDHKREIVGIVVDKAKLVKIKALLSQDRHTFARGWVSKKLNEIIAYANSMQTISFTDWDAFTKHIDDQPYQVNEVLAKITRESIISIVIGRYTDKAVQIARQRQADFDKKFRRLLPIVVYDMEHRCVYPLEELKEEKHSPKATR